MAKTDFSNSSIQLDHLLQTPVRHHRSFSPSICWHLSFQTVVRAAPCETLSLSPRTTRVCRRDVTETLMPPHPIWNVLAAEGVLFTRAYTTQASCSSSRASLLITLIRTAPTMQDRIRQKVCRKSPIIPATCLLCPISASTAHPRAWKRPHTITPFDGWTEVWACSSTRSKRMGTGTIIDLLPTALDALGLDSRDTAGLSLRPILEQKTPEDWPKYVFGDYTSHPAAHFFPRRSIRNRRYELIQNIDSPG